MNTTKKIISILMCVLMILSIAPVSASAAKVIDFDIVCTKLDWIVTGDIVLSADNFNLPNGFSVYNILTYDDAVPDTPMGKNDKMIGGKSYTVHLLIQRNGSSIDKSEFDAVRFMLNDKTVDASLLAGMVYITFGFTVRKEILNTFNIYTEGYAPGNFASDFTLTTDCVGLTVKDYYFQYRDLNQDVPPTDVFEAGGNYCLWIDLYLKDGFFLPDDFDPGKFKLIDIPCQSKELYYQGEDENGRYFVLKLVPVTPTYVNSLELVLDGYEYGAEVGDIKVSADECAEFKNGNSYSNGYGIFINDGKDLITDEDTVFGYDTQYYLGVRLLAKNGYSFYNLTKMGVTLKGYSCNFEFDKKSYKEVILYFALPELIEHKCADCLSFVKEEAADCKNDGIVAHYLCTCGKKYSDDNATNEITDTVISAPGHNFMMTFPKVDASCGAEGRKEAFRVCKRCNNKYSLSDENTPLTDAYIESLRIPATGAHIYDNGCDTECNECFAARTITHTYDNDCDAECNVCKTSRTPDAHKGGTATCTEQAKCSVCGEAYGSVNKDNHKSLTALKAVDATCTKEGKTEGKKCTACGVTIVAQKTVAKKAHTLTTLKAVAATYKATGLTEGKKCADCGKITVAQKTVAKKVLGKVTGIKTKAVKLSSGTKTTLTLAWNKVEGAEAYEIEQRVGKTWKYVGTTKKTSLTVKKLKANKSYKFRVRAVIDGATPGTYSKTFTAKTVPLKTTLTLKAGKKALTASWKTVANITGYEVQYSTSKKFTKKTTKTVTIKKAKTTKTTIKKLTKGKKYYVKVRAYKTVGSKKIYSAWSSVKTVKVK